MPRTPDRLTSTTFRCLACRYTWEGDPARIDDDPSTPWHPWAYFAPCPGCGEDTPEQAQTRHLRKMWAKASGPKSAEGKAAAAKNLEGHPTPEETLRTRFNAMKHGLNAEVATYFPARPGGYPQCDGCEYLHTVCHRGGACRKQTELFMRHRIAFETRDASLLTDLRADLHATLTAIVQNMMLAIIGRGVEIETPEWHFDKEGTFHLARYIDPESGLERQIMKIEEHPLLKRLGEFVSRFGLDLNSQGMTPKAQDDEESIRGQLSAETGDREVALEYQRKQTLALEALGSLLQRADADAKRDPILIEHQAGTADG
jgi:hypothetical protein